MEYYVLTIEKESVEKLDVLLAEKGLHRNAALDKLIQLFFTASDEEKRAYLSENAPKKRYRAYLSDESVANLKSFQPKEYGLTSRYKIIEKLIEDFLKSPDSEKAKILASEKENLSFTEFMQVKKDKN